MKKRERHKKIEKAYTIKTQCLKEDIMDYRYMPFYVQGSALSGLYYQPWNDQEAKDMQYLKEMYPKTTERMQQIIDEECDRQEFEGSILFDQYPDRLGVNRMVNRVFDRMKMESETDEGVGDRNDGPDDNWMKDMITIMLLSEMYRRRATRRKQRRFY